MVSIRRGAGHLDSPELAGRSPVACIQCWAARSAYFLVTISPISQYWPLHLLGIDSRN
jgi:hypothetical protein